MRASVTPGAKETSAPISKHFAQTRLLIWADDGGWLEIYVKIGIHSIVTKIIFFQHWALQLVAALFHVLGSRFSAVHASSAKNPTSILESSISKAWTFSSSSSISS